MASPRGLGKWSRVWIGPKREERCESLIQAWRMQGVIAGGIELWRRRGWRCRVTMESTGRNGG